MIKSTLAASGLLAFLVATGASAQSSGHGDHGELSLGEAASAENAMRTIDVSMQETKDGRMIFVPAAIEVAEGETGRFSLVNDVAIEHQFVFTTTVN